MPRTRRAAEPAVDLCEGCPLARLDGAKAKNYGKRNADVLIVTDAPTQTQLAKGMAIPGYQRKAFDKVCADAGLDNKEFAYTSAVRCSFDKDHYTAKEINKIRKTCAQYLRKTIQTVQPEVIVPFGAGAAGSVLGRAVKIMKSRGVAVFNEEHQAEVLPMYNPGYVAQYPQHYPTFKADFRMLKLLEENDYDSSAISHIGNVSYELVDDLQFLVDMEPELLSFDLETLGLRSYTPATEEVPAAAIMTMQFCVEEGKGYTLSWDHPDAPQSRRSKSRLTRQLRQLLQNPETYVVGHNLKFDKVWSLRHTGIDFSIADDTLMMAAILDENISNNLDDCIKRHVPEMAGYADEFNKTYDKSRMDLVPLTEIVEYGGADVDAVFRLFHVLLPKVEENDLLYRHYRYVSMQGVNMFSYVDLTGMDVNEEQLSVFQQEMQTLVAQQYQDLIAQVPAPVKREHLERGKELKFSRADFVTDILFDHPEGFRLTPQVWTKKTAKLDMARRKPSTSSKDHLPYFFEECPFTEQLATYIKNTRMLGTNIIRFREKYITDGRIYPIYNMHITSTGRTSSNDPNGQNFPKRGSAAKAYRRCFQPPTPKLILEADLSQAELRIAAHMANERTMLSIYNSGGDIHMATACIVMGMSEQAFARLPDEERGLARFKAKAVNFGFLYGMGWRGFVSYAKTQYGIEFTEDEAQRIREDFFRKYSGLRAWHKRVREEVLRNGWVQSLDGRIRHLPMIYSREEFVVEEAVRQAVNSPVQEFASSLGVMSMARLNQQIDPTILSPFGFVHDAIYCTVEPEYLEWGAKTLKWYMESNPLGSWFGLRMRVPITADVGFGKNLADTVEMEGLRLDEPYDFSVHDEQLESYELWLPEQREPRDGARRVLPEYLQPILVD